jgi:DNA-binding CsgD family transcriptional regulator
MAAMVDAADVPRFARAHSWRIVAGVPGWEADLAAEARTLFDDAAAFHVVRFRRNASADLALTSWFEGSPAAGLSPPTHRLDDGLVHPGVRALVRGRAVIRLSDLVDLPRFRDTPVFASVHAHPPGTRFATAARLEIGPDRLVLLGAHRARSDFTGSDLGVLEQLQAVLAAAVLLRGALERLASRVAAGAAPVAAPSVSASGDYWPTHREQQVLGLLVQGLTNRQIARRLDIAERTVRKHLDAVYSKSEARGRASVTAWWLQRLTGRE